MNRATIYVRVSTEEQAREGYSIDAQINTLQTYAGLYNYEIVKIYRDEGISGKSIERPALQEMLSDARNKTFDVLLVWKISRLSRNLRSLLNIVDMLDNLGISFISQSETFNTSTPVGRMTLQILGSIAEFERNTIIENVKLGLAEKAKRGEWLGGRVYGYYSKNKKLHLNPEQARIVEEIFMRFIKGESIYNITQYLRKIRSKTINDKNFDVGSVRRILGNPIYIGKLSHKNEKFLVQGIHEPIIKETDFQKVQERLKKDAKKVRCSNEFILSGLLKCPICRGNMVRYMSNGYRYYRCGKYHNYGKNSCRGYLIRAEKVETDILDEIKALLKKSEVQKELYDKFNLTEVFDKDFAEKFNNMDKKVIKDVLKYLICKIELTEKKSVKSIAYY